MILRALAKKLKFGKGEKENIVDDREKIKKGVDKLVGDGKYINDVDMKVKLREIDEYLVSVSDENPGNGHGPLGSWSPKDSKFVLTNDETGQDYTFCIMEEEFAKGTAYHLSPMMDDPAAMEMVRAVHRSE